MPTGLSSAPQIQPFSAFLTVFFLHLPRQYFNMRFSIAAVLPALAFAQVALAGIGVHCGTTNDATLSDCQALLNDDATWSAAWAGTSNVCQYVLLCPLPSLRIYLITRVL